ncbi:DUF4312 family protein [Orbaceae bacterium ac157xtp]
MKKNQQITVQVTGKGDSKQKAFAIALQQVQKQVLKNANTILLRIEPLNVEVVNATEQFTTERFLFLFLPRKRAFYEVTLDVTVELSFVDLDSVKFTSKTK